MAKKLSQSQGQWFASSNRINVSQVAQNGSQILFSRWIKVYSKIFLITGQSGGICQILMIKTHFLNSTTLLWYQKISIAWRAVLTNSERILSFWGESKKNVVQMDLTVRYQPTSRKETTMWTRASAPLFRLVHLGCPFQPTLIWTVFCTMRWVREKDVDAQTVVCATS